MSVESKRGFAQNILVIQPVQPAITHFVTKVNI
jgi:hypothetical protein